LTVHVNIFIGVFTVLLIGGSELLLFYFADIILLP